VQDSAQFGDCVQKLLNDFKLYDKAVDIVSCWQFLFTEVEQYSKNVLLFDRFPRLSSPSTPKDQPKTPDFAVLLSDEYGIVADIKSGFPLDDKGFLSHAGRLLKYDLPLSFKTGVDSRSVIPSDHDILLVIPMRDAQEIVRRIEKFRAAGDLRIDRNLIAFEWVWDSDQNEYVFRKVAGQTCDFRDASLPANIRLSSIFTERGASLKVSPDKIKSIKAAWQFCNDTPPPIYTLVFLWTKVFYHLLDAGQRQLWRRRDPRKVLWIEVSTERLVEEIVRRYPIRWGHWTDWARAALDVLVSAGLARKIAEDKYTVGYRNLVRELGEPTHGATGTEVTSHPREYARILATYICRATGGELTQEAPATDERSQGELFRR
jgi:hypothetical protein